MVVMFYRQNKFLPLLVIYLAAAMSVSAQEQAFDGLTIERLEREVTRQLLEKDAGELANELARDKSGTSVLPLLRRLTIFARAGHRARVLETLNQLAVASDMPPVSHRWVVAQAIKKIIGSEDLMVQRAYYERIMPTDAGDGEQLLLLWEASGDTKELDAWLAARVKDNPGWMQWRMRWRARLGTAGQVLDALASEVKANPQDSERVRRYQQANNWAGDLQDVAWLADVLRPDTAYEFYELATLLKRNAPATTAKLLERSLSLPFTERDMQLIRERVLPMYSMTPRVKSWEKQFRFWTKRHLAEVYKANSQPQLAQLLVEELVRMKAEDETLEEVHQLAGAVQAQSGMRVVEAKILRDEASEKESAEYWINRAQYYIGRKEYEAVMDSYRSAFAHLPFKPQDKTIARARLSLLRAFAWFGSSRHSPDSEKRSFRRPEVKQVLLREFNSVPPEQEYAFWVAHLLVDDDLELDELLDTLFVRQIDTLGRLLAGRAEWGQAEVRVIEQIVCRSSLTREQRSNYWTQLEALARAGAPSRLYYLADVMVDCDEPRRAIPLLVHYLNYIQERKDETIYEGEWMTLDHLFAAYLKIGDWQSAEKLLLKREDLSGLSWLPRISLAAVEAGAVSDSVRLWRKKANLDRRHLHGLDQLARTKAKEPLREMYLEMKKRDPLSSVPDQALMILK